MLVKSVKGVFFDIGGTLNFNVVGHWLFPQITEALISLECIYCIPIKRFSAAYAKCTEFLSGSRCIKTLEEEFKLFVAFYTMLAGYLPELELTEEKIKLVAHDKVYNTENDVFYDDVHDTLKCLSENYRLGVISDSWPSCEQKLKAAGLYDFLSCVTLSCHLGVCKPDPKMFEHALGSIGLPAAQTVLIDDDRENLEGAQKLGIQPVLINTKSKKKDEDFLTINCVSEILEYL